jgi:hypothetical protein
VRGRGRAQSTQGKECWSGMPSHLSSDNAHSRPANPYRSRHTRWVLVHAGGARTEPRDTSAASLARNNSPVAQTNTHTHKAQRLSATSALAPSNTLYIVPPFFHTEGGRGSGSGQHTSDFTSARRSRGMVVPNEVVPSRWLVFHTQTPRHTHTHTHTHTPA